MGDKHNFEYDPYDYMDYAMDFTDFLKADDMVASYTMAVDSGITVESFTNDGKRVTFWVTGGVPDRSYRVTCKITTTGGAAGTPRKASRSVWFRARSL